MNAFDNHKKKHMPQTDAQKDTTVLLDEIIAGVPGNFTAVQAKLSELKDHRVIKEGEDDDIVNGGVNTTRGGIRPRHAPLVP